MYEYNGLMHCICCDCVNLKILGNIWGLSYAYVFAALFQMFGMNWSVT